MHRYLSHRAFEFKYDLMRNFSLFLGCCSIQAPPDYWIIQHNQHHRVADTDEDLHTPRKGFLKSFLTWQFQPKMNVESTISDRKKLFKDKNILLFSKYYSYILWSPFFILSIIDFRFGLIYALASTASSFEVGFVNYFCHKKNFGYRNTDTKDDSVNNRILSFFLFGAGLHHNHHAKATAYDLSDSRSIDITGKIIHYFLKK